MDVLVNVIMTLFISYAFLSTMLYIKKYSLSILRNKGENSAYGILIEDNSGYNINHKHPMTLQDVNTVINSFKHNDDYKRFVENLTHVSLENSNLTTGKRSIVAYEKENELGSIKVYDVRYNPEKDVYMLNHDKKGYVVEYTPEQMKSIMEFMLVKHIGIHFAMQKGSKLDSNYSLEEFSQDFSESINIGRNAVQEGRVAKC